MQLSSADHQQDDYNFIFWVLISSAQWQVDGLIESNQQRKYS